MKVKMLKTGKWGINFVATDLVKDEVYEDLPLKVIDHIVDSGYGVILVDKAEDVIVDDKDPKSVDLSKLNLNELKAVAKEKGIDAEKIKAKKDVIALIEKTDADANVSLDELDIDGLTDFAALNEIDLGGTETKEDMQRLTDEGLLPEERH